MTKINYGCWILLQMDNTRNSENMEHIIKLHKSMYIVNFFVGPYRLAEH